jgi:hypothetical protein
MPQVELPPLWGARNNRLGGVYGNVKWSEEEGAPQEDDAVANVVGKCKCMTRRVYDVP